MIKKQMTQALIAAKLNSGGKLSKQELATFVTEAKNELKSRAQDRKRG
jgi:hypothetical protein